MNKRNIDNSNYKLVKVNNFLYYIKVCVSLIDIKLSLVMEKGKSCYSKPKI